MVFLVRRKQERNEKLQAATGNYLERAKLLGHDVEKLKAGETIRSVVTISSLEQFKDLFANGLSVEQRQAFAQNIGAMKGPFGSASFMRLMNYVYGEGSLTADDTDFAQKIFPIKVQAVSASTVTIDTDQVIGPSGAPSAINASQLIFDGGSITVQNTVFGLTADTLTIKSGGTKQYHVGILGCPGTVGSTGATGSSFTGPAANGSNASAPTPGICTGASDGGNGSNGQVGGTGGTGGLGGPGLPSLAANITIGSYASSSTAPFVVYTRSGSGGQGGTGGTGGAGQQGGNGGNGCDSGCEGTDGGNGGNGGQGGTGGQGGNGGPGTDGFPTTISFPAAAKSNLQTLSQSAPPGAGGNGGQGGAGGQPGSGGTGGKHKSNGQSGSVGQTGSSGSAGTAGTVSGAPGSYNIRYTS